MAVMSMHNCFLMITLIFSNYKQTVSKVPTNQTVDIAAGTV